MYLRPEQILEQYEIEASNISKGRDCFLCETENGTKALKEYRGSRERAQFLAQMLDCLTEHNIIVEQIVFTKEMEPFALDEDEQKYMLVTAFRGAECDTKNKEDMISAVKLLASVHNASESYEGEVPEFVKAQPDSLFLQCEKHNRELKQVRNYIRSKKQKKNEFEETFLRRYDEFAQKAKNAADCLKQLKPDSTLVGFCHGDFNQHNVIFSKTGMAVVNFGNFSYNLTIGDLANFIRKMMEKNNWDAELGIGLIKAYNTVRTIKEQEYAYLYFSLAYPEKFWKIANHYNKSHKAWLCARNMEKLAKVTAQECGREQFLQNLKFVCRLE